MKRNLLVAFAGNPNTGKSTIFNQITGGKQKIGNYPGVTIEKKEGAFSYQDYNINVVDLPGIYSLSAFSPEEIVARNFILEERPDIVIDIVDSSNVERNLYLTVQIMELNVPVILVFNMSDEAVKRGLDIDTRKLSEIFGVPIITTVGHKGKGIIELKEKIVEIAKTYTQSAPKEIALDYGPEINESIEKLIPILEKSQELVKKYPPKWLALKLLENDTNIINIVKSYFSESSELFETLSNATKRITEIYGDDPSAVIAERRYGFISGAVTQAVQYNVEKRHDMSDKIDKVLTNRLFGIPIFFLMMYLTFWFTFTVGEAPMGWIENFFSFIGNTINNIWPADNLLKSLVVDGIIGGVGAVIVFLPNIILLFLAIGILEYSGYMSRAAFVIDKIMHKVGLHGKSFIPMLIGFGCNVPGIMATKTLGNTRERFLTIMVLPLMSCGARLPIYLLIIPIFFPESMHAPILWSIYFIGIILALVIAKILKTIFFKGESSPFVMELPPYRVPTLKSILFYIWDKSYMYIRKAGTIILAVSIILWFLSAFPRTTEYSMDYSKAISELQTNDQFSEVAKQRKISELENSRAYEETKNSYMGKIGETLEPVFAPLGFDWKITTAILGALAAKEVFVSQLGIINKVGDVSEDSESLRSKIRQQYSPLIGFCIMLWALISAPCIATFAITKQETGSWKFAAYQFFGLTALAYVITLFVYQIGRLIV